MTEERGSNRRRRQRFGDLSIDERIIRILKKLGVRVWTRFD
jgi:hypothetical protein